jgi:anti-anti-sigma regulatory factor
MRAAPNREHIRNMAEVRAHVKRGGGSYIRPGILMLPVVGTLDSMRTQILMDGLLERIVATEAKIAIIDITGVATVDTLVAQHMMRTVAAVRLMGAECIISGIRPQIAPNHGPSRNQPEHSVQSDTGRRVRSRAAATGKIRPCESGSPSYTPGSGGRHCRRSHAGSRGCGLAGTRDNRHHSRMNSVSSASRMAGRHPKQVATLNPRPAC